MAPSFMALDGGWIFDDGMLIAGNPRVHGFAQWTSWFTSEFWDVGAEHSVREASVFWRPLVLASYALDWTLGSGSPLPFHLTNLVLHAAVTVLSFLMLRRYLGEVRAAFIAALLFALHPAHCESVAWISGRPDPLMMLGVLVAMQGLAMRLGGRRIGILIEVLGTAVAYLSKEQAVAMPVLALVEAWVAAGRGPIDRKLIGTVLRAAGPQLAVAACYMGLRQVLLPMSLGGFSQIPLLYRLGIVLETLGRYVRIVLWPNNLTAGAALIVVEDGAYPFHWITVFLGGTAIAGAAALAVWGWRRRPTVFLGILVLAVTMFPASNVLAIGYDVLASPRFLYMPSLPLAMIFGLIASCALGAKHSRVRQLVPAGLLAACAVLGAVNVDRSLDYGSTDRFWRAEIRANPQYLPALEYFAENALRARRPRQSLNIAYSSFAHVDQTGGRGFRSIVFLYALRAVLRLTPDLDRPTLQQIHDFANDTLAGRSASVDLPSFQMQIHLPQGSRDARVLQQEFLTEVMVVDTAARLGRWSDVEPRASRLLEVWPDTAPSLTLAASRARDVQFVRKAIAVMQQSVDPKARRLAEELTGTLNVLQAAEQAQEPAARRLLAGYYSSVNAWGEAYASLRPDFETAERVEPPLPIAETLAEVSFRAGNEAQARRLLGRLRADEVEARLNEWRLGMQWIDAPLQLGEEPLPDVLARRIQR